MKNKRVTQNDILFFSISLFVIVVIWIGFNIYHAWVTSTISSDLQMQITPISPNFDKETINTLKKRNKVDPIFRLESDEQSTETGSPAAALTGEEIPPTAPTDEVIPEEIPIEEEPLPSEEPSPTEGQTP